MSISLKDFESGKFIRRIKSDKPTQAEIVLGFLKTNKRAFKSNEIAKKLKLDANTVRCILGRFKKKRRVTHNTPYYAYRR